MAAGAAVNVETIMDSLNSDGSGALARAQELIDLNAHDVRLTTAGPGQVAGQGAQGAFGAPDGRHSPAAA